MVFQLLAHGEHLFEALSTAVVGMVVSAPNMAHVQQVIATMAQTEWAE